MRIRNLVLLLALLAVFAPLQVAAQTEPAPTRNNVISANPFLLIAAWFNAEYERKISTESVIGVRVSTLNLGIDDSDGDADYASGRVFWRYYPTAAFKGFFFGVGAGLTNLDAGSDSESVLGAGFDLGYNWLLGRRQNFYISIGAGADRLFGGDLEDVSLVIPTVRIINIGFAF